MKSWRSQQLPASSCGQEWALWPIKPYSTPSEDRHKLDTLPWCLWTRCGQQSELRKFKNQHLKADQFLPLEISIGWRRHSWNRSGERVSSIAGVTQADQARYHLHLKEVKDYSNSSSFKADRTTSTSRRSRSSRSTSSRGKKDQAQLHCRPVQRLRSQVPHEF